MDGPVKNGRERIAVLRPKLVAVQLRRLLCAALGAKIQGWRMRGLTRNVASWVAASLGKWLQVGPPNSMRRETAQPAPEYAVMQLKLEISTSRHTFQRCSMPDIQDVAFRPVAAKPEVMLAMALDLEVERHKREIAEGFAELREKYNKPTHQTSLAQMQQQYMMWMSPAMTTAYAANPYLAPMQRCCCPASLSPWDDLLSSTSPPMRWF